jgi:putative aldouronate transport system substrate-binding protein
MKGKAPTFEIVAAPYPVLKSGDKPVLGQLDRTFPGPGLAISSACKNPDDAVKWADYAYSDAGHLLFNFGVEGDTYTMVNGYPTYTDKVLKDPKLAVQQSMARFTRSDFDGPFVQDARYFEQYASLPEQQDSVKVWSQPTNEKQLPPVTQTQDESHQFASIMNDINTLRDEAVIKTIVGQSAVSDWDNIVAQMKQIGIDDAVKLRQAALDRFKAR